MTAFTEDELNDLFAESATYASDQTTDHPQAEPFCINSDSRANWYLRKLGNLQAEKARVQEQAALIVSQIEADADRLQFMFGSQLETYARQKMQANGRNRRSVSWLQGTVSFRSVPASIRVVDTSAALAHAKQIAPELVSVVTSEKLDATAYAKMAGLHLEETGIFLPGIDRTPERESVKITFGK